MWFWARHLLLAIIIIIATSYFLLSNNPIADIKETKNAAAEGLSRFYASINSQAQKNNERDKFVLDLPPPAVPIDAALQKRNRVVNPSKPNWTGEFKPRRFTDDSTFKTLLTQFAQDEDIAMYWYLNKDYVIKDHFRIDSTFNSTLYQVGRAINDDFENEVYTFFCYKQKAAVITVLPSKFVRDNCQKLSN